MKSEQLSKYSRVIYLLPYNIIIIGIVMSPVYNRPPNMNVT